MFFNRDSLSFFRGIKGKKRISRFHNEKIGKSTSCGIFPDIEQDIVKIGNVNLKKT